MREDTQNRVEKSGHTNKRSCYRRIREEWRRVCKMKMSVDSNEYFSYLIIHWKLKGALEYLLS
jgi:hypothetical protein